MGQLFIKIRDNKNQFLPGEIVEGNVSWQLSQSANAIELRLIWFTSGKGDTDVSVEDTRRFDAPALGGDGAFRFQLPLAPYSFSGRIISLSWALEMVAMPGANVDAARFEFTMSPTAEEIVLPQIETPDPKKIPAWLRQKLKGEKASGNSAPQKGAENPFDSTTQNAFDFSTDTTRK